MDHDNNPVRGNSSGVFLLAFVTMLSLLILCIYVFSEGKTPSSWT